MYDFIVVLFSAKKKSFTGQVVTSFCMGTERLYQYVHNSPFVKFCDIEYVNDPENIAWNPNVTAINAAIEVPTYLEYSRKWSDKFK